MLNWTLALSCLLISFHAGFWSNGVGGTLPPTPRAWVKMVTLLPRPGGPLVHALGFSAGKLLKPSSYWGPVLAKSGFGPFVAGRNVGNTLVAGFGAVLAEEVGAVGAWGLEHASSNATAPPAISPAAVSRMKRRRLNDRSRYIFSPPLA